MQISTLRARVTNDLGGFTWDQWAQLGVFAPTVRHDRWAADPEALLLFTFEVGRSDPRLFDEVLDWLLTNERLVSVQRLRNLCADEEDRALAEGALAWLAGHQSRARFRPVRVRGPASDPRPLFRTPAREPEAPDEAFASVGYLRPKAEPSGKSRPPEVDLPMTFAFRMRRLFGVGSRSEVIGYLLTVPAPDVPAHQVAEAAGYAKRNVNDTLAALVASGIVTTFVVANERRYYLNRGLWGELLGLSPDTWPEHRDWPQLLWAVRRLARWLEQDGLERLSPYMLASQARSLMDELESSLAFAGVSLPGGGSARGESYWPVFVDSVERVLATLST